VTTLRPGTEVRLTIGTTKYRGVVTEGPLYLKGSDPLYRVEYKRGAGKVENLFTRASLTPVKED